MTAVKKPKPSNYVLFAVTVLLAFLFIYPVLFALMSAFKSNGDILKNPIGVPTSLYVQNFKDLFEQSDFTTAILHSLFLTIVSELLIVCIVPMAAYGIERRKSRTTSLIYTYFLAGMMIPFHLYMFPLFREMKLMHLPLLGPCTGSMVILNGLGIWNDYLMPYLVLPSGIAKTITVEIAGFVGQYTARWDIVFAGTIISIVPALIIFCMFQKYFVKGITAGAAKG